MLKVSIITATYNSSATIVDAIKSVQEQSHSNIEHIIVDGLSTDDTIEKIKSIDQQIKIISEKDNGIYDAMNKGIAIASGDIIGILNSDDFYASKLVIESVVRIFSIINCDALYGDLLYVDSKHIFKVKRKWISGMHQRKDFLKGWMPPHPTFFVKKEVYEKYGVFNLELGTAADYELMLRFIYKHQINTFYLPEVLIHMRTGGASNKNIFNRLKANHGDRQAWRVNDLKPGLFTLYLKPLRKISQFFKK